MARERQSQDPQALRDRALVTAVLEHGAFDDLTFDGSSPREIFEGWAERLKTNNCTRPLSEKQRAWIEGVARRLDIDLGAQNLISSGAVKVKPKEQAALHEFLGTLDRPTLPPHRRCTIDKACRKIKGHEGTCR
jgi:hypothetical protein